jgi:hypothetical protein
MKKLLFFIILVFIFATAGAQTTDYLQKKEFQTEKKKIYDNIDAAKKPASELKKLVNRQSLKIDSLNNLVKIFGVQNALYADSINKMSATVWSLNDQVKINHDRTRKHFIYVLIMLVILFVLILGTFIILWRKIQGNFAILNDHGERINAKLDREIGALRLEVTNGIAKMHAMSDELNQKISSRFDHFETEHTQIHQKMQENNSSLKEQIQGIRESAEEKFQNFKSALAAKGDEFLSHTKALKSQVDKDIQTLASELKKIKPA